MSYIGNKGQRLAKDDYPAALLDDGAELEQLETIFAGSKEHDKRTEIDASF
jgi:hypothetical protein